MAGKAKVVSDEYKSALVDLTFNSKPMINMLTLLAEENSEHAQHIVNVISDRIRTVETEKKMPALYLLDSILKNVAGEYVVIISKNIVEVFCCVFESAPDERKRMQLFKLRNTWNSCMPSKTLYDLDVRVTRTDPNWPVTAPTTTPTSTPNVIHINPKFLQKNDPTASPISATLAAKIKKQRLLEEEKRVQEQLRVLQADKLKREREQHELVLHQQQQERERLIAEQKRQLEVLRKQQQNMADSSVKPVTSTGTAESKPAATAKVKTNEVKVEENAASAAGPTESTVDLTTDEKPIPVINLEKENSNTAAVVIPHSLVKDPRMKNDVVVNDPRLNRKKGTANKSPINLMNKIVTNLSKGRSEAVRKIRPYINPMYAHSPQSIATARHSFASSSFNTLNLTVSKGGVENVIQVPVCSAVPDSIVPISTGPLTVLSHHSAINNNNFNTNSNLIVVQCHDNAMSSCSAVTATTRPLSTNKSQFQETKSVQSDKVSLPTAISSHSVIKSSAPPTGFKNSFIEVTQAPVVISNSGIVVKLKPGTETSSTASVKTTVAQQTAKLAERLAAPSSTAAPSSAAAPSSTEVPPPFSGEFKSLSTRDMHIAAQAAAIATAMHQMQSVPGISGNMPPEQSAQLAAQLIEIMQGTAGAISAGTTSTTSGTTTSSAPDHSTLSKSSTDIAENNNNYKDRQSKENPKASEVITRERSGRSHEKVRERSPHDSPGSRRETRSKQRAAEGKDDEKSKSKRSDGKDDEKSRSRSRSEGRDDDKLKSPERNLRSRTRERKNSQGVLGDEPPSKRLKDGDPQERGRKARARSPSRYHNRMERKIVSEKRVEEKGKELVLDRFRKVSEGDTIESSKSDGEKTSSGKERTSPAKEKKGEEEEDIEEHEKEFNTLKEQLYDIHKNKEKTGAIDQDMLTKIMVEIDHKAKKGILSKDGKDELMWQIRHIRAEAKQVKQVPSLKGNNNTQWRPRKDAPQGHHPERFARPHGPRGPHGPHGPHERFAGTAFPQGEIYDEEWHGPPSESQGEIYDEEWHGPPSEYMGDGPPNLHYQDGPHPPMLHEGQLPPHMRERGPHGSPASGSPYNANEHPQNMGGNMDGPRPPHMMDGPRLPHMMDGPRPPHMMDGPRPPHMMDGPRPPHMMEGLQPPHMMEGPRPPHMMDGPRPPHMMDGPRLPHMMDGPRPPHMMDGPRPPNMMDGPRPPHMMDGPRPPHMMDGPRPPHLMDGPPHLMDGPRMPHLMDGPRPPHLMDGQRPPHLMDGPIPPHLMDGPRPPHGLPTHGDGLQAPHAPQPPPPMPLPPLVDQPRSQHIDAPRPLLMDAPQPHHMDMPRPPHLMDVAQHSMRGPHPSHMVRPQQPPNSQPPVMPDMPNPAYRMEGPPGHMTGPQPPYMMEGMQTRHPIPQALLQPQHIRGSEDSAHPYHPQDLPHSQHSHMQHNNQGHGHAHPSFHMPHTPATFHPTIDPGTTSSVSQIFSISSLLGQLSAAGLLPSIEKTEPEPKKEIPEIKLVLDDLKVRNENVISGITFGKQCSSCGERFPMEVHSEHLDWHFRQNRKDKRGVVKDCRQWYFDLKDWVEQNTKRVLDDLKSLNFKMIPEKEEPKTEPKVEELPVKVEEPQKVVSDDSIPVGVAGDMCHVCMDPLDQYWDEDREEWRYRKAVRERNKTYHLHCFADYEPFELEDEMSPPETPLTPHLPSLMEIKEEQLHNDTNDLEVGNVTNTLDVSMDISAITDPNASMQLNTTDLNATAQFNTTDLNASVQFDTTDLNSSVPFNMSTLSDAGSSPFKASRLTLSMLDVIVPEVEDVDDTLTSADGMNATIRFDAESDVMNTIQDILRAAATSIKTKNTNGTTANPKAGTNPLLSENKIVFDEKEVKLREEISTLLSDMVDIVVKRIAIRESKSFLMLPLVSTITGSSRDNTRQHAATRVETNNTVGKVNENVVLNECTAGSRTIEPINDKEIINNTDGDKKDLEEDPDIAYSPYIENMDSPVYPVITTSNLACLDQEQDANFQIGKMVDFPNSIVLPSLQDGGTDGVDSTLTDVSKTLEHVISQVTLNSQSVSSCDNENVKLYNNDGLSVLKCELGVNEATSDLNKSVARVINSIIVDE